MAKFVTLIFLLSLIPLTLKAEGDLDEVFSTPTDLSDKKMNDAKEFVHAGVRDKKIAEGCKDKALKNCQIEEGGMSLESMIGKAYSLIFGGMVGGIGSGPSFTKKAPKANGAPTDGKGSKDTTPDYCMYGAIAYETLGGFIQQGLQKKADNAATHIGDVQLQSLISLKEAHKARKTTATWQSGVYGAISACYGAMAFTGINLDWKYWAKLGGAVALTSLYVKKAKKHGDAAKKVQLVIDSLPKAGDCNPWTGTKCFCKEATSKTLYPSEYQEVCVLNGGNFEGTKVALGCGTMVGDKVQYDEACACKKTNSCLKTTISGVNPKFEFGTNLMNAANTGFDLLSKGDIDQAKLNSYSTATAALASQMKPKSNPLPNVNLTDEQKKIADELKNHMPQGLANLAAASPASHPPGGIVDNMSPSNALSKLSEELKDQLGDAVPTNYRRGQGTTTYGAGDEMPFTINMPGQENSRTNNTEIVSFAEEAVNKADISKAPETPLFDIISNRYRNSGWKKLDTSGK